MPAFLPSLFLPLKPLGKAEGGGSCPCASRLRPVALPDVGLHQPCHKTRPQERGFNKRYRFLELRLGDFPEDRLCLTGGLCTVGTRLPLSSSAVSTAATLYLSLTTWKYYPLQAQCPYSCSATSPAAGGRAGPEGPSNGAWGCWAGLDQARRPVSRNRLSLLSSPDRGNWQSGWAQICLSVTGSKMDTNLPPISSEHQTGR